MRYIIFSIAVVLISLTASAHGSPFDLFTWINVTKDSQIYKEIGKAFLDELQPDNPEQVKPFVPYSYKYIARAGAFQNSLLVLIGYRQQENDPKEYDHFRAFSYDRITHRKDEIQPKDFFYQWAFIGLAAFEPSVTPDVVFTYDNCTECEAVKLLSSFTFDKKEKKWKMRIWPDNDPHLMIGSDAQHGVDDNWIYDCLYKIADFNGDGFADIAIHCRRTGEITKVTKDEITLYTIQKGVANKIRVRDKKKIERINTLLCKGQSSPLCK